MSMIPSNLARVPTFLASRIALTSLGRTNSALLDTQNSLSSGRAVTQASDDPIRASSILSINDRVQRSNLYRQNLSYAQGIMGILDSPGGPLGSTADLVLQAKNLASGQIGVNSDAGQRQVMAETVDSMIRTLFNNANYATQGLYLLGGSTPSSPPVVRTADGAYRYVARGNGLLSDLGTSDQIPLTLGGANALGDVSARQRGTLDLNPGITAGTRLADLRGARGLGVSAGSMLLAFNGGPAVTVDLTGSSTIGEVNSRLNQAITDYETTYGVTILGPGGISTSGQGINIDVAAGGSLTFTDFPTSTIATDLGLSQAAFTPAAPTGTALEPRLTLQTPLSALSGVTLPLDSIRISSRRSDGTGTTVDVNLSACATIDDVRNAVEVALPGVRMEINSSNDALDISSELAGRVVSIEDVPGGPNTAQQLGIRTFASDTPISAMNYGRGVTIVDNISDPTTGAYSRRLSSDFRVNLGNGQWFDVDLRPQDMTDVSSLVGRINAEFTAQIGTQNNTSAPALAAGDFTAQISAGANGFAFASPVAGNIKVDTLNNSAAAEQLGLKNLTLNTSTGEYIAEDRAGIRVDNLFSALLDLRDSLVRNDSSGIALAGQDIQTSMDRLTTARALVGSYDKRLGEHVQRLEDNDLLDKQLLSNLQDTDFADASVKLSNLSTQLQATLQSIGATQGKNLFDFLSL
jgi:flagellar hook-associated protein 3 FlgL